MELKSQKLSKEYFRFGKKTYSKKESIIGWSFLLPAVILGIIFIITPMVISLAYSFTDANLLRLDDVNFIGFDNFVRIFTKDALALKALGNSLFFTVVVVPLHLTISLGLALLLNWQKKFKTFLRWVFFSPVLLSLAVVSLLWINLFNPESGLINALLTMLGAERQGFLKDPDQAMICIILISAWAGAGYQMLIFLGAMKNIPASLYDAAKIDGANKMQEVFYITIPMLKNTMGFVLITMLIGAFRLIVQPMIMTGGGPVDSTVTVSLYIYRQGITFRDVGYSSAIAMIYTIIIATVALSLRAVFSKGEMD